MTTPTIQHAIGEDRQALYFNGIKYKESEGDFPFKLLYKKLLKEGIDLRDLGAIDVDALMGAHHYDMTGLLEELDRQELIYYHPVEVNHYWWRSKGSLPRVWNALPRESFNEIEYYL